MRLSGRSIEVSAVQPLNILPQRLVRELLRVTFTSEVQLPNTAL